MAGISMSMTVDDREIRRLIGRTQARGRDLSPAFKNIGEYMVREREGWFQREESPEGKPWQLLKVRTYYSSHRGRKYTKKGRRTASFKKYLSGKKILTKDHHLRRTVYRVGKGLVVIAPDKTSEAYAAAHQYGAHFSIISTRATVKIPARPHMGVTDKHRREFVVIVKEHLLSQ